MLVCIIEKNTDEDGFHGSRGIVRFILSCIFIIVILSSTYFIYSSFDSTENAVINLIIVPPILLFGIWGLLTSIFCSHVRLSKFIESIGSD